MTVRAQVVAAARWGIANAGQIHYAEVRPIPQVEPGVYPKLPFTTDCSGFVTMCYQYAGAPDPSGAGYDGGIGRLGPEYTGTLLQHGVEVKTPLPGDLIIYGPGTGHHVVIYLDTWHGAWRVASTTRGRSGS